MLLWVYSRDVVKLFCHVVLLPLSQDVWAGPKLRVLVITHVPAPVLIWPRRSTPDIVALDSLHYLVNVFVYNLPAV